MSLCVVKVRGERKVVNVKRECGGRVPFEKREGRGGRSGTREGRGEEKHLLGAEHKVVCVLDLGLEEQRLEKLDDETS